MSIRRALSISVAARYAELILALISSMLLARLLSPNDFGIFSIAASLAAIAYMLRNFGVAQYLIQAPQLPPHLLSAAFSLTLIMSWLLAGLLFLGAPYLADYYQEPDIGQAMRWLCLNFLVLPIGSVTDALLRRHMQFARLALISIASAITGLLTGVLSALNGSGFLALVWAANATTLTTVLLTLRYRPSDLPWMPGLSGIPQILGFGIQVGTLNMLNKGSDSATELVVGKAYGLESLGLYSRAFGVFMLFEYALIQGIRPVVLPWLSQARRSQHALAPMYLKVISLVSACTLPFFTFLYLCASEVMSMLYGDQWAGAVPVLQVLCLAGLFVAPTSFFEQVLLAQGRPGKALQLQSLFQLGRLGLLFCLIALPLPMTAFAFVFGAMLKLLLVIRLARQYLGIVAKDIARVMGSAGVLALAVAAVLAGVRQGLTSLESETFVVAICAASAILTWLLGLLSLNHPLADELRRITGKLGKIRFVPFSSNRPDIHQ